MPRLLSTLAIIAIMLAVVSPLLSSTNAAAPVDLLKFKTIVGDLIASKSAAAIDAEVGKVARAAMTKVNVESFEAVAIAEKKTPEALWAEFMPGVARKSLSADREALVILAGLARSGKSLPRAETDALVWTLKEKINAKIALTPEDRAFGKVLFAKFKDAPEGKYVVEGDQYVFKRAGAAADVAPKPAAAATPAANTAKPAAAASAMVQFITLSKKQLQEAADRELARLRKVIADRANSVSSKISYGSTSVAWQDARDELTRSLKNDYARDLKALSGETAENFAERHGLPNPVPIKVLNPKPSAEDLKAAADLVAAQRAALLKKEAETMDDIEKWSIMSWRHDQDARAARDFQQGNMGRHQLVNLDPYANRNEAGLQKIGRTTDLQGVRREIALQDRMTVEQVAQSRLPVAVAGKVAPVVEASKLVSNEALAMARKFNAKSFAPKAEAMRKDIPSWFPNVVVNGKTQAQYVAALENDFNTAFAAMTNEAKRVTQYAKEVAAATTEADAKRIAKLIEESRDKMRGFQRTMDDVTAAADYESVKLAYYKARIAADDAQVALFKSRRTELEAAIKKFGSQAGRDDSTLNWLRAMKPKNGGAWNVVVSYDPAVKLAELEASAATRSKAITDANALITKFYEAEKSPNFNYNGDYLRSSLLSKVQDTLDALKKAFPDVVL